jgi:prephenate dehydrogenase
MEALTYNEWLKSKEGYETQATILASNAGMYPDIVYINKKIRMAYEDYKRRINESTVEH